MTGLASCGDATGNGHSPSGDQLIWQRATNANSTLSWLGGTPAVADGKLFVEDANSVLAMSTVDGHTIWATQVKDFPKPGAENIVVRSGTVFISEVDSVSALKASDGTVLWRFHPDSNAALVGISADDRAVYTGQRGVPVVYALSVTDGSLLWRINVGQGWATPAFVTGVAVSGDTVYAGVSRWLNQNGGIRAGVVVALNRSNGGELWRYQTPTQNDDSQGLPFVVADALIINDFAGGAVIALDRANGHERWRVASVGAGLGPLAPPVVNGDHLYVASEDAYVYDISLSTGQVNWRQNTGTSLDGVAYCGGSVWAMNGRLERRNASDGSLFGHSSNATSARFTSNLATDGSAVYVTGYAGVSAYSCR